MLVAFAAAFAFAAMWVTVAARADKGTRGTLEAAFGLGVGLAAGGRGHGGAAVAFAWLARNDNPGERLDT